MISVQSEDFDLAAEYTSLREQSGAGAIVTFCGLVRDLDQTNPGHAEKVEAIELEHYPAMTEKSLKAIVDQACERWQVHNVRLIHRVGRLRAKDQIVFVGVSSAHRCDAFSACEFIMDYLKTQAPFWKKQYTSNGDYWVEAKASDSDAAKRWQS